MYAVNWKGPIPEHRGIQLSVTSSLWILIVYLKTQVHIPWYFPFLININRKYRDNKFLKYQLFVMTIFKAHDIMIKSLSTVDKMSTMKSGHEIKYIHILLSRVISKVLIMINLPQRWTLIKILTIHDMTYLALAVLSTQPGESSVFNRGTSINFLVIGMLIHSLL